MPMAIDFTKTDGARQMLKYAVSNEGLLQHLYFFAARDE